MASTRDDGDEPPHTSPSPPPPLFTLRPNPSLRGAVASLQFFSSVSSSPDYECGPPSCSGNFIAACHGGFGGVDFHDLSSRRIAFTAGPFGPDESGISLRRLSKVSRRALFHVRPTNVMSGSSPGGGVVRVFDIERRDVATHTFRTMHYGFCAATSASECRGFDGDGGDMILLPEGEDGATLRDLRSPPRNATVSFRFGGPERGSITSLAMSDSFSGSAVVAAGMEGGQVIFCDTRRASVDTSNEVLRLGRNPVLCLEMLSSSSKDGKIKAVAGTAGDAAELLAQPSEERGTAFVLRSDKKSGLEIVGRHSTCSLSSGGRPGVSSCAMRSDGKICAVGGWDRRVRIYDTKKGKPLAVLAVTSGGSMLKKYDQNGSDLRTISKSSVSALDFATDKLGMLAAGYGDGRISVWNIFQQVARKS